jgi:uncharacterized 2Fe-2S/4Fe-4S cluster protein (DUF4445 family)
MKGASSRHHSGKKLCRLEFEPLGRRGEVRMDQTLLDSAHQLGVDIVSICGGSGTCGRCRIQLVSGHVSEPTKNEAAFFLKEKEASPFRLACQIYPADHLKINIPPESLTSEQRTLVEGLDIDFDPDPPITTYHLSLDPDDAEQFFIGSAYPPI